VGFCDCGNDATAFTKGKNKVAVRAINQETKIDSDTRSLSGRH